MGALARLYAYSDKTRSIDHSIW